MNRSFVSKLQLLAKEKGTHSLCPFFFLLAENQASNFCFVALPRIECANETRAVVCLQA